MDPERLRSLRDFQLAHIRSWLQGDAARGLWIEQGRLALERAYDRRIDELVERPALERAVEAALAAAVLDDVARPLGGWLIDEAARVTADVEIPLGDILGDDAKRALEMLAEHPEIVDARLVRAVTQDPALESMMRDVLFEALVAFNERTNPFVASWGVPALLDSLPRIGRGAIRKAIDTVRGEFERRLEPEMRRFLEGFARKSLDRMVDLFADKASEPEMIALRRHALLVVLDEPLSRSLWPRGDPRHALARAAIESAAAHVGRHPAIQRLVDAAVEDAWARFAHRSARDVLDEIGVQLPDAAPFLDAVWPAVRALASDDAALTQLSALIDETHEAWLASQA